MLEKAQVAEKSIFKSPEVKAGDIKADRIGTWP